jgi:hypothetical protein
MVIARLSFRMISQLFLGTSCCSSTPVKLETNPVRIWVTAELLTQLLLLYLEGWRCGVSNSGTRSKDSSRTV